MPGIILKQNAGGRHAGRELCGLMRGWRKILVCVSKLIAFIVNYYLKKKAPTNFSVDFL